jgi:isoleucyl-tRNA synthetase
MLAWLPGKRRVRVVTLCRSCSSPLSDLEVSYKLTTHNDCAQLMKVPAEFGAFLRMTGNVQRMIDERLRA